MGYQHKVLEISLAIEIYYVDEAVFIGGAKAKYAHLGLNFCYEIWCNLMCYANALCKNPASQIQDLYSDWLFLTQDILGFLKRTKAKMLLSS